MALIKTKPTSPGRRFVLKPNRSDLHKGEPVHALTTSQKRTGARNNMGRQTTRLREGLCLKCGYDLRGSPDRCPECGSAAPARPAA